MFENFHISQHGFDSLFELLLTTFTENLNECMINIGLFFNLENTSGIKTGTTFTFFPLLSWHSAAVLDKLSTSLPVIATSAPSLQNKMAAPAPIPELAPGVRV